MKVELIYHKIKLFVCSSFFISTYVLNAEAYNLIDKLVKCHKLFSKVFAAHWLQNYFFVVVDPRHEPPQKYFALHQQHQQLGLENRKTSLRLQITGVDPHQPVVVDLFTEAEHWIGTEERATEVVYNLADALASVLFTEVVQWFYETINSY